MRFASGCSALLFLALALTNMNCSSMQEVDQSLVNHPAMDLHTRLTPERSSYLTILDGNSQGKAVGGCLTCAH
jgi:hypothetical protein